MTMLNDETFCKCIEDRLEKCEDFIQSFRECSQNFENIKNLLNCENFLKFINDFLTKEECVSYHHYLIYYMAPRCLSFSNDFKKAINLVKEIIENSSNDASSILKIMQEIYEIYVQKVLKSIFKRDINLSIEIALICDILTRLQLYVDCLLRSGYDYCKTILCSIKSRVYALL